MHAAGCGLPDVTQIDAVALIKCADVRSNAGEASEWGVDVEDQKQECIA